MLPSKRRRRLLLIAAAALVAGVLPPLLTLGLSWMDARGTADERLHAHAARVAGRVEDVVTTAEPLLAALAEAETGADTEAGACDDGTVEHLRAVVYRSRYFREAGVIDAGRLVCSSQRRYPRPLPVSLPGSDLASAATDDGGLDVTLGQIAPDGDVSVLVTRAAARGRRVYLGMDPSLLLGTVRDVVDERAVAVRVERRDGLVIARAGNAAFVPDAAAMRRAHALPIGDLRVVVGGDRDQLMASWWRNSELFLLLGVAISLPLFLLLVAADRRERSLDMQLADAIDNGELRVHYQPIHAAADLRAVGLEALIRWQHPSRGLIPPSLFVPLAESSGLIQPMTEWLMRSVRRDLNLLAASGHGALYVAVNLSPRQFSDPALPGVVADCFGAALGGGRIVLEVTERELLSAEDTVARGVIEALRADGARIALDDFGTGYSSLQYLAQFRFDLLKIDKSFVDAVGTESVTAGLVEDMVRMARRLGLSTIAEGVERAEQQQRLRELGVDYLQGWHLSAALPLTALLAYLAADRNPDAG